MDLLKSGWLYNIFTIINKTIFYHNNNIIGNDNNMKIKKVYSVYIINVNNVTYYWQEFTNIFLESINGKKYEPYFSKISCYFGSS